MSIKYKVLESGGYEIVGDVDVLLEYWLYSVLDKHTNTDSDEKYRIDFDKIEVLSGYKWDGPSGPVFHTMDTMEASLVHDILYDAIKKGYLPKYYRKIADKEYRHIMKRESELPPLLASIRAEIHYWGIRLGYPIYKRFKRDTDKIRTIN